jgi:hypothetical protein
MLVYSHFEMENYLGAHLCSYNQTEHIYSNSYIGMDKSLPMKFGLVFSLPILKRVMPMLGLVIEILGLPNGVFQSLRLIKLNPILMGLWKSTKDELYPYFIIL